MVLFSLSNFRFKIKLLYLPGKEKYQTFAAAVGHLWPLPTGLGMHFCGKRTKEEKDEEKR